MQDNLDDNEQEHLRKEDNKRKTGRHDNLDDDEKEQLRKYEKKGKNVMRDNLDDEKKDYLKKEDNKRKKERHGNLDDAKKEQLRKYEKKGKNVMRDNLEAGEKEKVRKLGEKRKMNKCLKTLDERSSIFDNVQMCSMTDPCILTTPAFRIIEVDFKVAIQEGPTYICDICWKFEFRGNVIKLKEPKYQADIYNEYTTGQSDGY